MTRQLSRGLQPCGKDIPGYDYMVTDPVIDCRSDGYKNFRLFCVILFAVYLACPLTYLGLLYSHLERILRIDDQSLSLRHATRYDPVLRPFHFLVINGV